MTARGVANRLHSWLLVRWYSLGCLILGHDEGGPLAKIAPWCGRCGRDTP